MLTELNRWLPPEAVKILLVLFLSFLTGLEREERKSTAEHYTFGGVRTFPLIGLVGYAMALLAAGELLPITLGFAVVGGFLMLSYRHKLANSGTAGVTTEMSGLMTYLVGALVYKEQFWIATTLSVAGMLLLELKAALESLAKRTAGEEIFTFTKFLLLSAVILPVLPNQDFGPFHINPFRTWLVVVAVSAVSYGSYVIQKLTKGQGGILLAAILGGAYSSTVTTIVLSRRAAREGRPHIFSAGILMACGMMYLRLAGLLALFNRGPGRGGRHRQLAPVPRARREDRRGQARVPATEPARTARRSFLCAAVSGDDDRHPPGRRLPRKGRRIQPGGDHGSDRRGSLHHGYDAVGRLPDSGLGGGRRGSRGGVQQQPGQGDLRVRVVRS
jgi:hypothetical protein